MFFEYHLIAVSMEACNPSTLHEYFHGAVPFQRIASVQSREGTWTVAEVVAQIDAGLRFYVTDERGNKRYVEVVRRALDVPYIRTDADGFSTNNLLTLPGGPLFSTTSLGMLAQLLRAAPTQ